MNGNLPNGEEQSATNCWTAKSSQVTNAESFLMHGTVPITGRSDEHVDCLKMSSRAWFSMK